MPMFDKDRKEVLDRLGELVIKDVAEAGGYGVVFGSSLDGRGERNWPNASRPNRAGSSRRRSSNSRTSTWWTPKPDR